MVSFNILDKLSDKFLGEIPNFIFFAIGLVAGILLFLILIFIAYMISKHYKGKSKKNKEIIIKDEYKGIINVKYDIFQNKLADKDLKEKSNGLLHLLFEMLTEIATLYYPHSSNPILEVSAERVVEFLDYLVYRVDLITDVLINKKGKAVQFITTKFTKSEIKDIKLSKVIKMKNNSEISEKPTTKRKGVFKRIKNKIKGLKSKALVNLTDDLLDYTFYNFFDDIGEDINKLYSGQSLDIKELNRKIQKYRRNQRKSKKNKVGDLNA